MYTRDVHQLYASYPMERHFASNIRKKWNLSEYTDPNKPAVFFGWYNNDDWKVIQNHKAPFIMLWGGADMLPERVTQISKMPNSYQIAYGWQTDIMKQCNVDYKEIIIPVKSYDMFEPNRLGEKIYVYRGWLVPRNRYFNWEAIVEPLFSVFGKDRFIFGMGEKIEDVYEKLYKECFVYLKPNERGGSTTMWELGHMGRVTIANNQGSAPNVRGYNDIHDIIRIIQEEAEKIGTVQQELSDKVKQHLGIDERWLSINYWNE